MVSARRELGIMLSSLLKYIYSHHPPLKPDQIPPWSGFFFISGEGFKQLTDWAMFLISISQSEEIIKSVKNCIINSSETALSFLNTDCYEWIIFVPTREKGIRITSEQKSTPQESHRDPVRKYIHSFFFFGVSGSEVHWLQWGSVFIMCFGQVVSDSFTG